MRHFPLLLLPVLLLHGLALGLPEGTNTVLVSHGNLARAATSVYPGEGEGLVFQPQADGGFVFVGRLSPTQWRQLAESLSP